MHAKCVGFERVHAKCVGFERVHAKCVVTLREYTEGEIL